MKNAIKSMTGFGGAKGASTLSLLDVNIRSVNGRFLELRVHLPREFISIEADIKKILSQYFHRGTVDVTVFRKSRGEKTNTKLFLHEDMATAWMTAASKLKALGGFSENIDLATILQLPQVVGFEEDSHGLDEESKAVLSLVETACEACVQEREREGEALQKELVIILDRLEKNTEELNSMKAEVNRQLKEKMEVRLKTRWPEWTVDGHRLEQELALVWDKSDITEELTRLSEHLKHYRKLLLSTKVQGKKLDFYTQELLREVNTIGSKSPSVPLTQLVVTAKTDIEKLREQVQNIE